MRLALHLLASCFLLVLCSEDCNAQSLQVSLDDVDVGERWEYNDWEAAQAAAAKSGKPILALFR